MQKKTFLNTLLLPGISVLVVASIIAAIVVMEMKISKKADITARIMSDDVYGGEMTVQANDEPQELHASPSPQTLEADTELAGRRPQ